MKQVPTQNLDMYLGSFIKKIESPRCLDITNLMITVPIVITIMKVFIILFMHSYLYKKPYLF